MDRHSENVFSFEMNSSETKWVAPTLITTHFLDLFSGMADTEFFAVDRHNLLQRARNSAAKWRTRAQALENERRDMKAWVDKAIEISDKASVEIAQLRQVKETMKGQLKMKDRGLFLRRNREDQYKSDIAEQSRRMTEMSKMIRERDAEIQRLKCRFGQTASQEVEIAKDADQRTGSRDVDLAKGARKKQTTFLRSQVPSRLPSLHASADDFENRSKIKHPMDSKIGTAEENGQKLKAIKTRDSTRMRVDHRFSESNTPPSSRNGGPGVQNTVLEFVKKVPVSETEKLISDAGGEIVVENTKLTLPSGCLTKPTQIALSVSPTNPEISQFRRRLRDTGLHRVFSLGLCITTQPWGTSLEKSGLLSCRMSSEVKNAMDYFVFLALCPNQTSGMNAQWRNVSSDVISSDKNGDAHTVHIKLRNLCSLQVIRLTPVLDRSIKDRSKGKVKLFGEDTEVGKLAVSIMNKQNAVCDFTVYRQHHHDDTLLLGITQHGFQTSPLSKQNGECRPLTVLCRQPSCFEICDGETMNVCFDTSTHVVSEFVFNLKETESENGQRLEIPLVGRSGVRHQPDVITLKRRLKVEGIDDKDLCSMLLRY